MAGIAGIYIYDDNGNIIGATGGKLVKLKNLAKDPDYYRNLGKRGGAVKGTKGGFASLTPEQLREVSAKGGRAKKGNK